MPVLIGASQDSLQRDYRIDATPVSYLLGPNGQVLYYTSGYKTGDEKILETKIETALAPAPPAPAPQPTSEAICGPVVSGATAGRIFN